MSEVTASFAETERAFSVEAHERIAFDLVFTDAFDPGDATLADAYRRYGRCVMVIDSTVDELYGRRIDDYFEAHDVDLLRAPVRIAEAEKSLTTVSELVDVFERVGLGRREPVLVVGGGLTTDPAGFAAATYRRSTPYIRVPTTLVGLIDASVATRVAVNHGHHRNRLGAYHASELVLLDGNFLATLPAAQVRNGMAELVKIAVVADARIFDLLEAHGEELLATGMGRRAGASDEIRSVGDELIRRAVRTMLELEVPNLRERDLDRALAFGHTWSPTLELAPDAPMLYGHAVTVDMALSATLAQRRGHVSAQDRDRIISLMSRLGLAIDSPYLSAELLREATRSIIRTRDGQLRAPVPRRIGACDLINDLSDEELTATLAAHRELCHRYENRGEGTEVYLTPSTAGV